MQNLINDNQLSQLLINGVKQLNLNLTAVQINYLLDFIMLLKRWNQVYNLTAIKNPQEMIIKHLFDSLAVAPFLIGDKILDLGTGAGLPGIPLAIINPQINFFLLDSNNKKLRFIRQVILNLKLNNIKLIQNRLENYQPDCVFNIIISRAVAIKTLLQAPLINWLNKPGSILLMQGRIFENPELKIFNSFSLEIIQTVHCLNIPLLNASRHLIELHLPNQING